MKKVITISEADRDEVQRFAIETESRQNLISFMLSNGMDTNTEQFRRYQAEYSDFFYRYDKAKNDITEKYVRPVVDNLDNVNWNLDFDSCELTILLPGSEN